MARILISRQAALILAGLASACAGPALAASPQAGATTFKANCAVCHGVTANAPSTVGPRLFGIVGRKAGTLPGFSYSSAMKKSGLTWTESELKRYIANPAATVPGNRMPYAGLHNANQVDDVIAFLATLK